MIGENIGKYRVLDRVGRGGMGTVYRAIDETLHREVAVKVLNAELNEPEVARRFRAEAITVARLSHPGIATVYELFEHDGQWLMVMEFVRGETFEQIVSRVGALEPQQAGVLCMQSLAALAHAHSMGVVHRDLKPANIMRTATGDVKVMDFGIARVSGSEHLTTVGFMMGTPAYMAPEQVQGHEIDARADLYAMGVVFFRLLTGQLPFKGDTPFAMAQAQVNATPLPIDTFRQGLPPWVDDVLQKALQKRPEDRFQSAMEFHGALQQALVGAATPAPMSSMAPTGMLPTPPRPVPVDAHAETMATPVATASSRTAPSGASGPVDSTGDTVATPARPMATAVPPAPAAASAPATTPAAAAAKSAAPAAAPPASSGVIWIGAAAALLVVAAVGGWWATSARDVTGVEPPPRAASAATDVTLPGTPAPVSDLTATATPALGAAPALAVATGASASGPSSPVAEGRGAAGGNAAVPAAAAPAGAVAEAADRAPAVSITGIKVLVVDGRRAQDRDATLNLANGRIVAMADGDGATLASWPYQAVSAATYAHARSPRWKADLAAPPDDLDVGGVFRTSRHYLTLQNDDAYVILRLENINVIQVIRELEARTGLSIPRTGN